MKISKNWKLFFASFLGILVLAFVLRVINLTILPVFADEAIYIRWSQIMSNEPTLRFLPLSDGKQPFYMWILMFLVRKMSDPLFAGRIVSVVTGLATIVGVGAASFVLFRSKKAALAAAFIWAISPFSFFFDRMALVDATLACFGVWTFLLAALTAKTMRTDMAMLTGFALGGALLTKSPALFFVLLLPSVVLITKFPKKKNDRVIHLLKLAGLLVIPLIIGFAMYNILRLGPNFQLIGSRNADYVYPLTHILQRPMDPLKPHLIRAVEWLFIWGPGAFLILFLGGAILSIKKFPKSTLLLLAWGIVPIVINAEYAKVFTARYVLFALPFLYIIAGTFLVHKIKIGMLLFAVFAIHAIYVDYLLLTDPHKAPIPRSERSGYLEEWTSGIGIREVSEYLKNEHAKDPSKQIVVGTEGFFGTLPDGLQIYMQDTPGVIVIGIGLGIAEVHPSLQESKKAGNKTYLVANSSRLNFRKPFEQAGLKVIMSFQKGKRPNIVREFVQHGERDTFYLFEVQ